MLSQKRYRILPNATLSKRNKMYSTQLRLNKIAP